MSYVLRVARPEDAAALLEIYAPYVTDTSITFEYDIPSTEEFADRIAQTLTRYPYLAEVPRQALGILRGRLPCAACLRLGSGNLHLCPPGGTAPRGGPGAICRPGTGAGRAGHFEPERLHRLSACAGPAPEQGQRTSTSIWVPHGGTFLLLRIQIPSLVRYGLDGETHRAHETNQPPVRPFPEVSVTLELWGRFHRQQQFRAVSRRVAGGHAVPDAALM